MSSEQTEWLPKASHREITDNPKGNMPSYPFLVHSQESLSQQTPPDVDNQRLVRQKRRRTSPEDHAILEAEYDRNPKPDKAARLEIVKKIALGEKEVQIWFQNRRQVTRRRSRPLLPHEILANLQSASQSSERAPSSSIPVDESSQQRLSSSQSSVTDCQSQPPHVDVVLSSKAPNVEGTHKHELSGQSYPSEISNSMEPSIMNPRQKLDTETQRISLNNIEAGLNGGERSRCLVRSLSQTLPKKRRPACFGSRRSASFVIHDEGFQASQHSTIASTLRSAESAACSGDAGESSQPIQRKSSLVRLSMSLDGKAEVTTSTGVTPSPPRSQPVPCDPVSLPKAGLHCSFSAIEPRKKEIPGSITHRPFSRPATGRSRDARTWEFYCDKDARDALTEQAEREESGSATAAIALIKSNSNSNKAVTVKSNKRNAHNQQVEAAKRIKANGKTKQKSKLSRSQSSLANMQTVVKSVDLKAEGTGKAHRKSGAQSTVFELYEDDSDKENWVPGTQQRSPPRRRPTGFSRPRQILKESLRHSASLGALMSQEREWCREPSSLKTTSSSTNSSTSEEKEDGVSGVDDEVATFMGDSASPREADDLDCVQNLLSLSQAAWQ